MNKVFNYVNHVDNLDKVSNEKMLCKLFEECGELAQAVNKTIGMKSVGTSDVRAEILEESADVIQIVFALLSRYDITYDELVAEVINKTDKWEDIQRTIKKQNNE